MTLNIHALAKAYEEYEKAPHREYLPETAVANSKLVRVKGRQWLGEKWICADGSVINKSFISTILSKWFITRYLYKKLTNTDIKAVVINANKTLNDSYSQKFEAQEDKVAFCEREVALCKAVRLVILFDLYQRSSHLLDPNFQRLQQKDHDNAVFANNAIFIAKELLEKVKANVNDPAIPPLFDELLAQQKKIQL